MTLGDENMSVCLNRWRWRQGKRQAINGIAGDSTRQNQRETHERVSPSGFSLVRSLGTGGYFRYALSGADVTFHLVDLDFIHNQLIRLL